MAPTTPASPTDQVRARATVNMPAVDQARYNTKETLRNYIRHERRIEFALEGQRYNDLKRWNIAHVDPAADHHAALRRGPQGTDDERSDGSEDERGIKRVRGWFV